MPGLLQYREDIAASHPSYPSESPTDHPEDMDLWMPSNIPQPHRDRICVIGLASIEEKLRLAQCYDSLDSVRHVLKIKSRMIMFKNKNVWGQREGTRSRATIDRIHEQARASAEKYRRARVAYKNLMGPGVWEETLRVLEDGDIRGYQDPNRLRVRQGRRGVLEDDQIADDVMAMPNSELTLINEVRDRRDGTGEAHRTLSWIWITSSSSANVHEAPDEILRAEWARSRARAARATEEVILLKEEMRRVIAFLAWKRQWWEHRISPRKGISKELTEGLKAYSLSQSKLQWDICTSFCSIWKAPLSEGDDADESNSDCEEEIGEENDDDVLETDG